MTMAEARQAFAEGTALAETAVGVRPRVYARLSGMTPADMVPTLAGLGYQGLIPIDFAHGAGYGEESKVILASGGSELEALTAKPIDAASEVAFQSLGARLGEAIDAGEVATGLLVHWPDRVCDSFGDLCRVATWCVALGKFWTLPEYFSDGERPYHHGSLESVGKRSADALLADLAGAPQGATLAEVAASFCRRVRRETERVTAVIAMLAKPQLVDQSQLDWETPGAGGSESPSMAERLLCEAVGVQPCQPQRPASDALCFNPHGAPARSEARLAGGAPPEESFVYGASQDGNGCAEVTCDVPATGFTRLGATARLPKQGLLKRMVGGGKGIAEPSILRNQFMAVSLNDETGGISGVFSASRGNRLSLRLVAGSELSGDSEGGTMVSEHVETLHSDAALGELRSSGQLRRGDGQPIAEFSLRYRLRRGSRALEIEGTIRPQLQQVRSDSDAWKRALALRVAVAEEAAIMRPLVRDKVQSSAARKLVAPLGVLIDEADKQTLVCGHGLPLHRKVGDRFLDTLVGIVPAAGDGAGQGGAFEFRTTLAFDCPAPVAFARSLVVPLRSLPIEPSGQATSRNGQAWLMHVSAPETLVTDMRVARRRDGKLAARMQVVQTRAKTSRVKLQFCAFAHAAFLADDAGIERSLDELPENVRCNDGVVELTLGNHEAVDLVVVFDV
jgi:alpha-mannosidase